MSCLLHTPEPILPRPPLPPQVRNAAGGIVQFMYGDDGMDPVTMEGKDGKPMDFDRLLAQVG